MNDPVSVVQAAVNAVEKAGRPAGRPMEITLDIAAALSAVFWPLVILLILLLFRDKIPALISSLAGRITKLTFAGVTVEMAKAQAFTPAWSGAADALDLRSKASSAQIADSTRKTFMTQIMDPTTADYAAVDLGGGFEWLTSRLFIMAILFARMKGVKAFVFTETAGNVRRRYLGWAELKKVRWALAQKFPWLENQYAEAYYRIFLLNPKQQPPEPPPVKKRDDLIVVSSTGRLESTWDPNKAQLGIDLLTVFLDLVQRQMPPLPMPDSEMDWELVDAVNNIQEHASWLTGQGLEELLGEDLHRSYVPLADLRGKNTLDQMRQLLAVPGRYVALTAEEQRFDGLIDRQVLLEKMAQRLVSEG